MRLFAHTRQTPSGSAALPGCADRSSQRSSSQRGWVLVGLALSTLLLSACERVGPDPVVAIEQFEATPSVLSVGETLTLRWRVQGASACSLELARPDERSEDQAEDRLEDPAQGGHTYELPNCAEGTLAHRVTAPGPLQATLSAVSEGGRRHTRVLRGLEVTETPTAAFRALPGDDPLSFTFDAGASVGGRTFTWTFGDGAQAQGVRVQHRYAAPGRYTVTLTVRGGAGASATASKVVTAERERLALFDGETLDAWERVRGGEANWPVEDGAFVVRPGGGVGVNNLRTKEVFGDFRLHLEFWVPATPEGTPEQARGNSGVYLQGRYEVQILDSFGARLGGADDAGALYGLRDADHNASRPAETWQRFEITFRAARFEGGRKVENARVSVRWNGVLVHDEVELRRNTLLGQREGPEGGPIVLQDHGSRVRFRNVWLEPL